MFWSVTDLSLPAGVKEVEANHCSQSFSGKPGDNCSQECERDEQCGPQETCQDYKCEDLGEKIEKIEIAGRYTSDTNKASPKSSKGREG